MNEADKFLRDADALLHGEIPMTDDADEQALYLLARDLITADFSAETDLDALRPAALRANMKGKPRMSRRARTLLTIAAVVSLVAAAFLTVPPLRAFAQEVLRQIGIITITDAPTYYDLSGVPFPVSDIFLREGSVEIPTSETDPLKPLRLVEFETVPDGFSLAGYRIIYFPDKKQSFLEVEYTSDSPDKRLRIGQIVTDIASRFSIDYQAGGAQREDVLVRGKQGHWIDGFSEYPDISGSLLAWSEPSPHFYVWLQGEGLTRDEMLTMAGQLMVNLLQDLIPTPPNPADSFSPILTPQQVAANAGFDLATFGDLSSPALNAHYYVYVGEDFTQVDTVFTHQGLSVQQIRINDADKMQSEVWKIDVGDHPVEDVTVNGNPGVWIEDVKLYTRTESILIWTQDNFTFYLRDTLSRSREDIIEIAGSLVYIRADTSGE